MVLPMFVTCVYTCFRMLAYNLCVLLMFATCALLLLFYTCVCLLVFHYAMHSTLLYLHSTPYACFIPFAAHLNWTLSIRSLRMAQSILTSASILYSTTTSQYALPLHQLDLDIRPHILMHFILPSFFLYTSSLSLHSTKTPHYAPKILLRKYLLLSIIFTIKKFRFAHYFSTRLLFLFHIIDILKSFQKKILKKKLFK